MVQHSIMRASSRMRPLRGRQRDKSSRVNLGQTTRWLGSSRRVVNPSIRKILYLVKYIILYPYKLHIVRVWALMQLLGGYFLLQFRAKCDAPSKRCKLTSSGPHRRLWYTFSSWRIIQVMHFNTHFNIHSPGNLNTPRVFSSFLSIVLSWLRSLLPIHRVNTSELCPLLCVTFFSPFKTIIYMYLNHNFFVFFCNIPFC